MRSRPPTRRERASCPRSSGFYRRPERFRIFVSESDRRSRLAALVSVCSGGRRVVQSLKFYRAKKFGKWTRRRYFIRSVFSKFWSVREKRLKSRNRSTPYVFEFKTRINIIRLVRLAGTFKLFRWLDFFFIIFGRRSITELARNRIFALSTIIVIDDEFNVTPSNRPKRSRYFTFTATGFFFSFHSTTNVQIL